MSASRSIYDRCYFVTKRMGCFCRFCNFHFDLAGVIHAEAEAAKRATIRPPWFTDNAFRHQWAIHVRRHLREEHPGRYRLHFPRPRGRNTRS